MPISKVLIPESADDIRNLSQTNFFSKQYEVFIADWILPIIKPYLDPGQYGGMKGSSINHYLISLLNFIHMNIDQKPEPHCGLLAMIDLQKAYNYRSFILVIQDLYDMHVPA